MNSISNRVLKLREEKKFSRKELAELAEVSQPTIYNIENGKTENITLSVGKKIAKALGISFGELFEIETKTFDWENNQNEIDKLLLSLKEKNIEISDLNKRNDELKDLAVQLILIIHSKDILIELMSFSRISSIRNNRGLQIEKLSKLIESQKQEILNDIEIGLYSESQYENMYNKMNRVKPGKFFNLLKNIEIEKLLDENQFNLYIENAG